MKCKKCDMEMKLLDDNHLYCDNEKCELYDKGWDKVVCLGMIGELEFIKNRLLRKDEKRTFKR